MSSHYFRQKVISINNTVEQKVFYICIIIKRRCLVNLVVSWTALTIFYHQNDLVLFRTSIVNPFLPALMKGSRIWKDNQMVQKISLHSHPHNHLALQSELFFFFFKPRDLYASRKTIIDLIFWALVPEKFKNSRLQ